MIDEFASFRAFCQHVTRQPDGLTARCPSASEARSLRKRFYRLRAQLPEPDRSEAFRLSAIVVGRYLTIKPAPAPVDWTQLETQDDNPIPVPEGNRLDHAV